MCSRSSASAMAMWNASRGTSFRRDTGNRRASHTTIGVNAAQMAAEMTSGQLMIGAAATGVSTWPANASRYRKTWLIQNSANAAHTAAIATHVLVDSCGGRDDAA